MAGPCLRSRRARNFVDTFRWSTPLGGDSAGREAVCDLGLGDDRRSFKLLEAALEAKSAAGTVPNYLVLLANIGNVYLHRRNYLTAIDCYRRALTLAREINDPVSIQKWSYNIRLAYARLLQSVEELETGSA